MNYQQKYLKYKTKYLNLFSQYGGLQILSTEDSKKIKLKLDATDKIIYLQNYNKLTLVTNPTKENPTKHYNIVFNSIE